uniref:Uncharacterized protein n=1 Tax=viral metagenome TaxID=1070528 RepID=A0A6M3LTU8_9ZZZZ
MKLSVGTRIYNGGDMANIEHFGTITHIHRNARFGDQYEITPDEGTDRKPYSVPPCIFSEKYLGHGGTRFVTEDAYNEWDEAQRERFLNWAKRTTA